MDIDETNDLVPRQTPLQNNSEECNALRSLLLGLCHQCAVSLQKANSYQELILDELDAHRGNTSYLEAAQRELSCIQTLVAQILQELPPVSGERLNLSRLMTGVLDRYCLGIDDERFPEQSLPEETFVSADAFELQELLLNLLEGLDRVNADDQPRWNVTATNHKLTRQEASALRLKDAGEYSFIGIRPVGTPEPSVAALKPFEQRLQTATILPPVVIAQWCGGAAHNGAGLYFDETLPRKSAVVILPRLAAEKPLLGGDGVACGAGKTILLVDDEDMIWDVLSDMLQELGYQVVLAGDGREAVQIYASNPGMIDLVILDMLMPNMGGRETFFLLKEIDPKVRVLASSGYVSQEEIQDVMDAGAAGFLRKPYRMADLAKKICEILGKESHA